MKIIRNILVTLVGIAFFLGLVVLGTQIFFKKRYDIDLFATINNFKTLSQPVDEATHFPDIFDTQDEKNAQTQVNASIADLITFDEETNKYTIHLTEISSTMGAEIDLSDKELAAFAQMMVVQQMDGKIKISESTTLDFWVKQIKITDVQGDGSATFNTVVKFDLSTIKNGMDKFPMSIIKKYVPDSLYVSSTVDITKDATDNFKYTVSPKTLTFNNLTSEETANMFKTLDHFLKIGSAENLNKQIGETVMTVLVGVEGDEEKQGLATGLKPVGATGYKFTSVSEQGHFVITIA